MQPTAGLGVTEMNQSRWMAGVAVAVLLAPAVTFAEGLIPWPWLESNRYRAWKQDRDQQKASWYAQRSGDQVGARQFYYKGKDWPPYPRPEGLSQIPTHIYHAAHYWPHPYICSDRDSVRQMTLAQEDAGWVSETTLYDYHFDADTQRLNRAGGLHVRWILENAPAHRKTVFVQAAANNATTQMRLVNVQDELIDMVPNESIPPVIVRVTRALGRPAQEVDKIQRSDLESLPIPRISPAFGEGSSSSGSTSSAGK